ncbi:tetratricopeptide repeat protein [Streptomyces sp. NPDC046909]|uniref:tetratricopeptide repeat protein n=1 Tax=Streptomyces sp. NPDC046909 TaxID=3155617 RepID=UPI0033EE49F5
MERFDVFFSYAHGDGQWPVALAENLQRLELDVWLDAWEMAAGQRVAARLQDGLTRADAVVAVVTPRWIASEWCGEEFAAAITASADGRQRLIPVLWGDVATVPPFIASRLYVDFRTVAAPGEYEAKVRQLARAVRGLPPGERPRASGVVVPPEGLRYRPDGPLHAELRIGTDAVVFSTGGAEVTEDGPDPAARQLDERLRELRRARQRVRGDRVTRTAPVTDGPALSGGVNGALAAVGRTLGEWAVNGEVGAALRREAALARDCNAPLRIGLQVDAEQWRDLPWESLVVPGAPSPLVLSENVDLYRRVRRDTPPVAMSIPGPLRILAVVASPEAGEGELLDYEWELAQILDAVGSARTRQGAYVRVLNWGSVAEIRAALEEERFHVLHLSCHAGPGVLYLEKDDGGVDRVDAQRFMDEVLPPGRGVPLVVLAGCSTALAPEADDASEARTGMARELLGRGVPSVLAMTEAVTDRYATELAAQVYEELARAEHAVPLTALSRARRRLEAVRQQLPAGDPWAAWPEWATPSLFLAGPPLPLFDAGQGVEQVRPAPERVLEEGMVVRKVGEFVGRRAELRRLLAALRDSRQAGVLIHGIGGVGKSTLTAELLHHLGSEAGLVVPVPAATAPTVDSVLETLRKRLLVHCVSAGLPEDDPLRRVAAMLVDASPPWRDRWEVIQQVVLPRLPLLLVLDNAEDLLTDSASDGGGRQLSDPELAAFLASLAGAAPRSRLLITSRHPFGLPQRMHRRLTAHHLGPLSLAETRKLIWRLPGLDALGAAELQRAYTDVGGHPRALEYLDALLRGGEARFPDIADRMEEALERRGVRDPERWLAGVEGDLDKALAETVTLAVDDVLLDTLLGRLEGVAGARRLLDGLAVYRRPVDRTGAAWLLSDLIGSPERDPVMMERMGRVNQQIEDAKAAGVGPEDGWGLPPELVEQFLRDCAEYAAPPVELDGEAEDALRLLLELGLVAPAPLPQDEAGSRPSGLLVHRWTADAIEHRNTPETLKAAHLRAAAYWRWRFDVRMHHDVAGIVELIEAARHHRQAGDLGHAFVATRRAAEQLHVWGAWDWEQRLLEESLTWCPVGTAAESRLRHLLALVAISRGEYVQAEQGLRRSLAINEELGLRDSVAIIHHELGTVAQELGRHAEAEEYFRRSLAISEELGLRVGVAADYHHLGVLAQRRQEYAEAEQYFRKSLAISEEDGSLTGMAASYHHLGVIAEERGQLAEAEQHHRNSLAIEERLGNPAGAAASFHQIGTMAERQGKFAEAEEYYRGSLDISEAIGDRANFATTTSQLGALLTKQNQPAQGVPRNAQALILRADMGIDFAADIYWLSRQRAMLGDGLFERVLLTHLPDAYAAQILTATAPRTKTEEP